MNIVINAVLAHDKPRGVGRYFNNLLPALAKIDKENEYYVYYGKWMSEYSFLNVKQKNIHFIELDIKNNQVSRNLYLALILPLKCKKYKPDLFFLIDTQAILTKPCKMVSTIHDLAEFVVPEKYTKKQALVRRMIVRCQAKLSDYIITDSEYSKKDICKRLGVSEKKVGLVYISVEQKKDIVKMDTEDYFLFVSETEKAKNLMELVNAYALLPEEIKDRYMVYVVGKKGNDYENIINRLRELGLFERFKFFGYLSDDELNRLYAKAYAFVFPSFFEGFGLPVIEAMAKGTPVLCSDASSIPEVGGDAVLTFSPYDAGELAKKLCLIVNTEGLRETMIQKGLERVKMFNSETTARETMEIFKRIIENG